MGCNGVAGNGWGEEAAGDERPWLRGRLRTANGCGETARDGCETAWVQGGWLEIGGEKKAVVMGDLGCADGCGRQNGCGETARMAADGVGATEWLEMGGEKGKEGKRMGNDLDELHSAPWAAAGCPMGCPVGCHGGGQHHESI